MHDATSPAKPAPTYLNLRLSVMMFLQYAIWGAWLPLLYPYLLGHLKFDADQIAMMFAFGAVGCLVAPFIAGQIADRWFSTEKFLGISHIAGAVLVWQLSRLTTFNEMAAFAVLYSLIYTPTLSLTNSLSFHHLRDKDRDFGKVRVWGTIGWICVGIGIGHWLLYSHTPEGVPEATVKAAQAAGMADAFKLSAILGALMGVYCFFLPSTPPSKGKSAFAVFEAMGEIRHQPLLTLFLIAVPISCIHQFHFSMGSSYLDHFNSPTAKEINKVFGVGGGGLMTIGQMSEILVLAVMPLVAKFLPRKLLLLIGVVAYGARMALFAFADQIGQALTIDPVGIAMLGVAMHGLCFGCFIFVAFMVVDEETPPDVRASAQSLFGLVVFGVGIIVGGWIAPKVAQWATVKIDENTKMIDYTALFSVPMWASIACFALLAVFYPWRSPKRGMTYQTFPPNAS